MLMASRGAPLATIHHKVRNRDAHWNTGSATIAMGTVSENAASAESDANEFAVDVRVNQVGRCGYLRASLTALKITAWVRRGRVELQRRKGQFLEVRHA
jgi:hypothetical protein